MALDRQRRARRCYSSRARHRSANALSALTNREREVLSHIVAGRLNKQIAAELGLSVVTVKVHRGQVMRKMGAKSIVDLVRAAEELGIARSA